MKSILAFALFFSHSTFAAISPLCMEPQIFPAQMRVPARDGDCDLHVPQLQACALIKWARAGDSFTADVILLDARTGLLSDVKILDAQMWMQMPKRIHRAPLFLLQELPGGALRLSPIFLQMPGAWTLSLKMMKKANQVYIADYTVELTSP